MTSFCPRCKLTFEAEDLAAPGPPDAPCPRCDGPLQPIKSNVRSPHAAQGSRERSITPTAPAGKETVPRTVPSFTDSLTPTRPGGGSPQAGESPIGAEVAPGQDEPTMPGGAAPAPTMHQDEPTVPGGAPSGPMFIQDEPTLPTAKAPAPPADEFASAPSPSPSAVPAGIVPPAALGGPDSANVVRSPGSSENTGLSDVFAPVGALDPSSGSVIGTGPVDRPQIDEDALPGQALDSDAASIDQALDAALDDTGRAPKANLLDLDDGGTGNSLELDLSRSSRGPAPEAGGASPVMTTGQIPKARPEMPLGTRPLATHEIRAVRQGIPGWAKILVLLVFLGVAAIIVLEMVRGDEEQASVVSGVDSLADVAAETARAELLLADLEKEQEQTRKKRRGSARKHKSSKSKKSSRAAKAKSADFDDEDEDDEDPRALALQHYKAGNEQLKKRAFSAAVQAFRSALRADPSFAYAHRGLGVAYASMKEPKKAIQQYRKYLKKAPDAPDAAAVRAILEQAESTQ